jgi:hypothetical protein
VRLDLFANTSVLQERPKSTRRRSGHGLGQYFNQGLSLLRYEVLRNNQGRHIHDRSRCKGRGRSRGCRKTLQLENRYQRALLRPGGHHRCQNHLVLAPAAMPRPSRRIRYFQAGSRRTFWNDIQRGWGKPNGPIQTSSHLISANRPCWPRRPLEQPSQSAIFELQRRCP